MKKIINDFPLLKIILFILVPILLITTNLQVILEIINRVKVISTYSRLELMYNILLFMLISMVALAVNTFYIDFVFSYHRGKKLAEERKGR